MEDNKLLKDYTAQEKTAYLHAIASLATADRSASAEELEYLSALSEQSGLSSSEQEEILGAAKNSADHSLPDKLEILKSSELRFSLIADLIHFAGTDQNYSEEEKSNVAEIAKFLNVNQEQFAALDQFVDETKSQELSPEQVEQQNFLTGTGIEEKLKSVGINLGSLTKGLLGTLAPLILGKLLGGKRSSGMPGLGSGGLGSLISSITKGRSGSGGSGGLLGSILSQLTR
ncbi:MAG: TerB family tellurite resistance protein [Bacteroidota bacterium]